MSRSVLAARLLDGTGAGWAARRLGRWDGVLVLNYHRVGDWSDDRWDTEVWSASAEQLEDQLTLFARETDVIPADAIPEAVGAGRGRRIAITFDDGYRDNHDVALPLLRALGLPATFFVTTGFVDRPRVPWWDELCWMVRTSERDRIPALDPLGESLAWAAPAERAAAIGRLVAAGKTLPPAEIDGLLDRVGEAAGTGRCAPDAWADRWMTWDMVRALRDGGMTVGGHTVNHPVLARLPVDEQREEVTGCARRLKEELGQEMTLFSYPVGTPGTFDAQTAEVVRGAGVRLAFAYDGGIAEQRAWDPLAVPRASVSAGMSRADVRALVTAPRAFARW